MTDLSNNFTTDTTEAINDNRAALCAVAVLLVQKGIVTFEEIETAKAQAVSIQDRHKAEADEALREQVAQHPLAAFFRGMFG